MDADRLSEEKLAERASVTVERIRELVDLGILQPRAGWYSRADVMHVRVVEGLETKGIDRRDVASALASGHLSLGYLESTGRRFPRSELTFSQLGEGLGVGVETLQRLYTAFGLASPDPGEHVREEDLPILKAIPVLFGAGVGEGEVLRAVHVWAESARRVAQFQTYYFHHTVERPFRDRGLRDNDAFEAAIREVGLRMGHSGEDMLSWLFRRHSEVFLTEHQFEHVETALDEAAIRTRAPRGVEAAAFADVSGYTRLTEEAGDERAADISLTLGHFVNEVAAQHGGEVVKLIGDGVHFHFRDPADAVRASLEIVERVGPRGLPPTHIGVNAGPMIYDAGDYFGRTVNIAARIAAQASANQVFVGEDLVRCVRPRGFRLVELGPFDLKGIARPVVLYEARGDADE